MESPYIANPISSITFGDTNIPIFSVSDEYIINYEKISTDHLISYEQTGLNPFIEEFWEESEKTTVELIKRHSDGQGKLLDVGCGLGRILASCQSFQSYGMDISEKISRTLCGTKRRRTLSIQDRRYAHKDGFFDVVVCTDVLEHVFDINLCLSQIFRVTRSGGLIIIRVPYKENLRLYTTPDYPYDYCHIRDFDESSLHLLVAKVFNQSDFEFDFFGPYLIDPGFMKFPIRGPGVGLLFRLFFGAINLCTEKFKKSVVEFLLRPVEFHIIIRVH